MRDRRGRDIAMIFQDPLSSLNPVVPIGVQVTEVLERHRGKSRKEAMPLAGDLLKKVGIPDPNRRLKDYPHQLSGGMRQRALIAMALACAATSAHRRRAHDGARRDDPGADPRPAQGARRGHRHGAHHDHPRPRRRRRAVRRGQRALRRPIVERGDRHELFAEPRHPYTNGLLASIPRLDAPRGERLTPIPGSVADNLPWAGPAPSPRDAASPECVSTMPQLISELPEPAPCRALRCHHPMAPRAPRPRRLGPRLGPCAATSPSRSAHDAPTVPAPAAPAGGDPRDGADGRDVLVDVRGLKVHFPIKRGVILDRQGVGYVYAVDGVDLQIRRGETYGLVGESGCGKSTLGRAILNLEPLTEGTVHLRRGRHRLPAGRGAASPPQGHADGLPGPLSSLDPRQSVESLLVEGMRAHGLGKDVKSAGKRLRELLAAVGLPAAALKKYPHEFSGGQRQRIGIARALAVDPQLVVADEPVSALDVSVQAQVINLLEDLQSEFGLTYLVVAHDLAVVRHISDTVGVMYLGALVEEADADDLYAAPLHPYTRALMSAVPVPDPTVEDRRERILLTGDLPSPANPPAGCRFHTRCPWRQQERCDSERPELRAVAIEGVAPGHRVACHYAEQIATGALQPHRVEAQLVDPTLVEDAPGGGPLLGPASVGEIS
jgi:peptide/nickel transport system ATP-binding protein